MFELVGASESIANTALKIAASKLPIKCGIIIKK